MNRIRFTLRPRPPFRLDLTAWALRRRPNNDIDSWKDGTYRRALMLQGRPTEVSVKQIKDVLSVQVAAPRLTEPVRTEASVTLKRILGLEVSLASFYRFAARDRRLGPLVRRFRGFKPPRFPTVFEALLNGISCQQLSLHVGILLLNRLTQRFGEAAGDELHVFPSPEELAMANPRELGRLGYSGAKAAAIMEAARRVASRRLDLEALGERLDEDALEALQSLPGVGRWTADYVLLRGIGRLNIFPGRDVGARNNLARLLHLRNLPDEARLAGLLESWRPHAGLVYFHLLLDHLFRSGMLASGHGPPGVCSPANRDV